MAKIFSPGETGHEVPACRPHCETQRDRHHSNDVSAAEKPRHRRQNCQDKERCKPINTEKTHLGLKMKRVFRRSRTGEGQARSSQSRLALRSVFRRCACAVPTSRSVEAVLAAGVARKNNGQ